MYLFIATLAAVEEFIQSLIEAIHNWGRSI